MEKDFKDFETEAPTLTLEPDFGQEETPKEEKEPAEAAVKKEMEEPGSILRIPTRSFSMVQVPRRRWRIFQMQPLQM